MLQPNRSFWLSSRHCHHSLSQLTFSSHLLIPLLHTLDLRDRLQIYGISICSALFLSHPLSWDFKILSSSLAMSTQSSKFMWTYVPYIIHPVSRKLFWNSKCDHHKTDCSLSFCQVLSNRDGVWKHAVEIAHVHCLPLEPNQSTSDWTLSPFQGW